MKTLSSPVILRRLGLAGSLLGAAALSAATFTVTTIDDSGPGSLRDAIVQANANPGPDAIEFNLPGPGPHSIQPLSPFPITTDTVSIDGFTQPGAIAGDFENRVILVELNGDLLPAGGRGVHLAADECLIRGLAVNGFASAPSGGAGQSILDQGTNNRIEDNFLGVDPTGTVPKPSGRFAIHAFFNSGTTVSGNLIAAGGWAGIVLVGCDGIDIQNNRVGTDLTGTVATGVDLYGIVVQNCGLVWIAQNLVSGLSASAIYGWNVWGFTVEDNRIGTDAAGLATIGNGPGELGAVYVENFEDVFIRGNVLSGSAWNALYANFGLRLEIEKNLIGVDATGTNPLANAGTGLRINQVSEVVCLDNVVSGNDAAAKIYTCGRVEVVGNRIGTNATGTAAIPNRVGVEIYQGEDILVRRNTLSGQSDDVFGFALALSGGTAVVDHNFLGTSSDGTTLIPNASRAILLQALRSAEVTNNLVAGNGGTGIVGELWIPEEDTFLTLAENTISGNGEHGVLLLNEGSKVVRQNTITDNSASGIAVEGGSGALISGNLISGNLEGITVTERLNPTYGENNTATGNTILANSITDNHNHGIDLRTVVVTPPDWDDFDWDGWQPGDPVPTETYTWMNVGPTPNDLEDADEGPNNLLNTPVLTKAYLNKGFLNIEGMLEGLPNSTQLVQVFSNRQPDESGYGEGEQFLGEVWVEADAAGKADFLVQVHPSEIRHGHFIAATATEETAGTSEFSNTVRVQKSGKK